MRHLSLALLLPLVFTIPVSVEAQQLNTYQVCHTYQEQYTPGYYTNNGSYIQGGVYTVKNTLNCQTGEVYSSQPYSGGRNVTYQQPYYRQRTCNPNNALFGSILGGGLGEALGGGNGWRSSSNWTRNYNRNSSSGSYNYSNRNYKSNGWSAFGMGIGGLLFSC
jgi:hypothetical protein